MTTTTIYKATYKEIDIWACTGYDTAYYTVEKYGATEELALAQVPEDKRAEAKVRPVALVVEL